MAAIRVLIVDDFVRWVEFVTILLKNQPDLRPVGTASDGPEAVAMVKVLQPDLVLMEVRLPTLSGIEAAKQILQIAPQTKVLFVSQDQDGDVVRAALAAGAGGYVFKLVAHRELVPAMEAVLSGKRYVSQGVIGFDRAESSDS